MVGARQQDAAHGGDQHQQVELFAVIRIADQPRIREGAGRQTRQQHQPGVEHRVTVNPQQRVTSIGPAWPTKYSESSARLRPITVRVALIKWSRRHAMPSITTTTVNPTINSGSSAISC